MELSEGEGKGCRDVLECGEGPEVGLVEEGMDNPIVTSGS
jgi:hypothetical protein